MAKNYANSPQQKIHWKKLQLLGMAAHMKGSLHYIHTQTGMDNICSQLNYDIDSLEKAIKINFEHKIKNQKQKDLARK